MATITKLKNIDPYLVWADQTDFQGFITNYTDPEVAYPILLAKLDGKDLDPNVIGTTGSDKFHLRSTFTDSPLKVYAGHVKSRTEQLFALAQEEDYYIELSTARYRSDSNAGGQPSYLEKVDLKNRVIAVIDFGCPFAHEQYLYLEDSKLRTRIRYFWDQDPRRTVQNATEFNQAELDADSTGRWWYPVDKFFYGREMTSPVMERLFQKCRLHSGALDEDAVYSYAGYASVDTPSVHGAHVMDLAAGRINPRNGLTDAASEADIIFVQLPRSTVADTSGGGMSMYLHDALEYIHDKTQDAEQVVINLSFGATAGPHDGSSLIEQLIDSAITKMRKGKWPHRPVDLVIAAGNHYLARLHAGAMLDSSKRTATFYWEVLPDDSTDSFVELWFQCDASNALEIGLKSPSCQKIDSTLAQEVVPLLNTNGKIIGSIIRVDNTKIHSNKCCALIALGPSDAESWANVEHGVWSIEIKYSGKYPIQIDAWIERDDPLDWEVGAQQGGFVSKRSERELDDSDIDEDSVKRSMTGNKLAFGQETIVAGSYVAGSEYFSSLNRDTLGFDLSQYSAAGERINKPWPDYVAPTDELTQGSGIVVAGTRSGQYFRANGTSMAAPQVTRYLINHHAFPRTQTAMPRLNGDSSIHTERGSLANRLK